MGVTRLPGAPILADRLKQAIKRQPGLTVHRLAHRLIAPPARVEVALTKMLERGDVIRKPTADPDRPEKSFLGYYLP